MPRIISPSLDEISKLRQPLTAGEREVLDLFNRSLSADWEIYVQSHLNGLRPDFVLLNPTVGIAVFEVKDWDLDAMRYRIVGSTERDYRLRAIAPDGRDIDLESSNPIRQAERYRRALYEVYCPHLSGSLQFSPITAGVIFTRSKLKAVMGVFDKIARREISKNENTLAGLDPMYPVSGSEELATGNLKAIFPRSSTKSSKVMTPTIANDLRGWLVEPDFSKEIRRPVILDDDQKKLASDRTSSGYRRIKGPAGSGKSMVIAARAANLLTEGKKVLIVTFNITLWHYLRDLVVQNLFATNPFRLDRPMKNVTFVHFHDWCRAVCEDAGRREDYLDLFKGIPTGRDKDKALQHVLETSLPDLVSDVLRHGGTGKYDAILVDEGQDYNPRWWNALRMVLNDGGEMVLVADQTQDLYGRSTAWTDDAMRGAGFTGQWSRLSIGYRLPVDAQRLFRDFAERFLPPGKVDLPTSVQTSLDLEPCHLRWIQCDEGSAADTCIAEMSEMMKRSGLELDLSNSDLCVLTDDQEVGEAIVNAARSRKINARETFSKHDPKQGKRKKMAFFMGASGVKVTTIHSFKGWETRMLILHVSLADGPENLAAIYAGLTRLKRNEKGSFLTVVCSVPKLREYGSSWPEFVDTIRVSRPLQILDDSGMNRPFYPWP